MYPSLCVPNACDVTADEETAEDAFGKPEQDLLRHHERYAIKLKCVEWLEKWQGPPVACFCAQINV